MGQNNSKNELGEGWVEKGYVEIIAHPQIISVVGSLLGLKFRPLGRFRGIAKIDGDSDFDLVLHLNFLLRTLVPLGNLTSLRMSKTRIIRENDFILETLRKDSNEPLSRLLPKKLNSQNSQKLKNQHLKLTTDVSFIGDVKSGKPIESSKYWPSRFGYKVSPVIEKFQDSAGFSNPSESNWDTWQRDTYKSRTYIPYHRSSAEAKTQQLMRNGEIETFASSPDDGYRTMFLPGTASLYYRVGSDVQVPIPYRGNVPEGVVYPQFVDYMAYGCVTTDCKYLQ